MYESDINVPFSIATEMIFQRQWPSRSRFARSEEFVAAPIGSLGGSLHLLSPELCG